jgi:segregation and condensation protein A
MVMTMNTYSLPQFEGPLDLLLHLIEEEKMPLSDVALAAVTEQFMNRLKGMPEDRGGELADFLVVATKLLYLKSRLLLPYLYPEETEGPTLADQLKLYKEFVAASKDTARLWNRLLLGYGRIEPPAAVEGFCMPTNAHSSHLERAFSQVLKRLRPLKALPQVVIDRTVSLKEKIESIYRSLQSVSNIKFSSMTVSAQNRTEIIITFLAILELAKQQRVTLKQDVCFDDVEVVLAI